MAESTHVITKKGLKYLLKVGTGIAPQFTRAVAGAGVLEPAEDQTLAELLEEQTAVLDPICEMSAGERVVLDSGCLRVPLRMTSSHVRDSVYVTLVGTYAEDPDEGEFLYQLEQFIFPQPLSSLEANNGIEDYWDHDLLIYVKNADAAFFPADPNYQVSRQEFNDHLKDEDAHSFLLEKVAALEEENEDLRESLRHKVDKNESLSWNNMVLENDYTGQIGYCRDSTGTVFVNGYIRKETIPISAETIFTLPAGFKPSRNSRFVLVAQSGRCTTGIAYAEDGRMTIMTPPPDWASDDAYVIDFIVKADS